MAQLLKVWLQMTRNVLVEFDFHQALIFQTMYKVILHKNAARYYKNADK
jgi:hypothetical protein